MSDGMRLNEARKIIITAIKKLVPVMVWGPPGLGKSETIEQITDERSLSLIDLRLPQLDPTDIRGIPVPNKETGRTDWSFPSFYPVRGEDGLGADGPGVLFLDELEKAPPSVKNASLQLVLDRCVGDYILPDDWAIVCAGNREEDGCFSGQLGSALRNRMIHVDVRPDVEVWAHWANQNEVLSDVIGFLQFSPDLLYNNNGQNAFPSPRSWVMASDLIKSVKDEKSIRKLAEAAVGEGAANSFMAWSKVYRNVKPLEILNGNIPNLAGKDQSHRYAVVMAVAFYAKKHGVKKHMSGISKFLHAVAPELRVVFFRQQTQPSLAEVAKHPEFKEIVSEVMEAYDM